MREKITTTIAILLLAILGSSTAKSQTLVIWQKDGSKVYYSLDEQPKTTFTTENLVITTNNATINYPLSKIQRYTYEEGSLGINNIKADGVVISHHHDVITITGLPKGKSIHIHSIDGKQLLSKQSDGSNRQVISLSQFPTGVYVIKAETVNYKFMKR